MDDQKLRKIVNSSGFPLQLAIKNRIDTLQKQGGKWRVVSTEHAWKLDDQEGYIDLIIENDIHCLLVIECKRVRDTAWIFLVTQENQSRRQVVAWRSKFQPATQNATHLRPKPFDHFGWFSTACVPASPQAEFCAVDGHDAKSKPMLERVSAQTLLATEAIAREDSTLTNNSCDSKLPWENHYFSVIVTTADIKVAYIDPNKIDVKSGEIENGSFHSVPYVRFHKQFLIHGDIGRSAKDLTELGQARNQTIMVIQADKFEDFLESFELSS